MLAGLAQARADGLSLPYAPQGPGGQDSIETAGGTRCRQSMNGNGAYIDIGAGSVRERMDSRSSKRDEGSLIGYGRIIIPLGKRPERLNCKRLYDLEIERLKMEIEMLKMGGL